jgi:hypothetical protein
MARRVVEDMVTNGNKKKGKQIPIKEPSLFLKTLQQDLKKNPHIARPREEEDDDEGPSFSEEPVFKPRRDSFSKKWYALIAILIIGGGAFIFLSSQPQAIVVVSPKNELKDIDLIITAGKDSTTSDIAYTPLEENEEVVFTVPSTGAKEIDRRAQGQVLIFNSFSKTPQTLAARTRFQTPDKKIFRTSSAVKVPGYTVSGGKIVPGNIEVTVYADETGSEYNVGYVDLTLPGLASNATQFAKIIARSKTELTGGFSGKIKLYDEALLLKERQDREKALAGSLAQKIQAKIPEGSTLFSKAVGITYSYDVNDRVGEDKTDDQTVGVTVKAQARGMLLKTAELQALLAKTIYPEEKEALEVENLESLAFALSDEKILSQKTLGDIEFSLQGKSRFVWVVSNEIIQKALAGTPKNSDSYKEIFKTQFPTIISAQVENFRPFWMRHFPNDPSKIIIKKVIPGGDTPQ